MLVLLFLSALVTQLVAGRLQIRAAPLPPSQDPFYIPPSGFGSQSPGTVLAHRQVQIAFQSQRPLTGYTAYQLLYRTTSANFTTPIATVTTVIQPTNARKDQLVSFSTAEDSDNSICAPSYNYQTGSSNANSIVGFEELFLIAFLNEGYTVSAPDYEGYNSAFSAGRLEGHAVLDGLKAAINYSPLGFNISTTSVAGYGYSGGAISNTWAAALHPTYASQLKVVGWASGGTPSNLSGTLEYIDGGVAGLLQAYNDLDVLLGEIATPAGKAAINQAYSQCAQQDIIDFAFKKFQSTTYQTLGDRILYNSTVESVTSQNVLGVVKTEVPSAPIYLAHALYDEIIPWADIQTTVQSWCKQGINSLIFTTDTGPAEHASFEALNFPGAFNFIQSRFNGEPAVHGCVINSTVFPELDPSSAATGLQTILGDLQAILTGQIGPDDGILKANLLKAAIAAGNGPPAASSVVAGVSSVVATVTGKVTSVLGVTTAIPKVTVAP